MSRWTFYQLLVVIGFSALIIVNNLFAEQVGHFFSFVDSFIEPSILIIFFTVILIIWTFTSLLLLEMNKGKPLFVHRVWRMMPAIIGILLFLSVCIFIVMGLTVFSDISPHQHWLLDLIIVYFLSLFYVLTLSIFIRYSAITSNREKILISAHTSVLIIIFVILFLPMI